MPVTLPVNGKADWTDYVDYWRDADATWMQDRLVLRVQDDAGRDALGQTPGGVVYNTNKDALEVRSAGGGYKTLTPIPPSLAVAEVAGQTTLSYTTAAGKGVVFNVDTVAITTPKFNLGVLTGDGTGISLKVGAKTAKLSTDATSLVSDSPVSAPSLVLTGAGTVLDATNKAVVTGALTSGAITAASLAAAGAISGQSASVGGTTISAAGRVTVPAAQGVLAGAGWFYGDAGSAIVRNSSGNGVYLQVAQGVINISGGGTTDIYNQARFQGVNPQWISGGAVRGLGYCVSAYGGDPGVGNMPEGSIWIS